MDDIMQSFIFADNFVDFVAQLVELLTLNQ